MHKLTTDSISALNNDGFTLLKSVLKSKHLLQLASDIETVRKSHSSYGVRHLLSRCKAVKDIAHSGVLFEIASKVLGEYARPVRALLFDKTPNANWYVTWHQDLTIPVQNRIDIEGYKAWSTKDGILHVQPPAYILEKMISLRIHLDACSESNGAIKFLPGSHENGILEKVELKKWREEAEPVLCAAEPGDIVVMRPLILHSSSKSAKPVQRRVLHIEYAGIELPQNLEWSEA